MADFLIENANGDINGPDVSNPGQTRILQVYATNFDGGTIQIQSKAEGALSTYIDMPNGTFTSAAATVINAHHTTLRAIITGAGGSASNINVVLT